MTALPKFLLSRIDEDEKAARRVERQWPPSLYDDYVSKDEYRADADYLDHFTAFRVLAECDAKRTIVELRQVIDLQARASARAGDDETAMQARATRAGLDAALTALALPYADHPDYRDEWKP